MGVARFVISKCHLLGVCVDECVHGVLFATCRCGMGPWVERPGEGQGRRDWAAECGQVDLGERAPWVRPEPHGARAGPDEASRRALQRSVGWRTVTCCIAVAALWGLGEMRRRLSAIWLS